jgi:hypothetical protein
MISRGARNEQKAHQVSLAEMIWRRLVVTAMTTVPTQDLEAVMAWSLTCRLIMPPSAVESEAAAVTVTLRGSTVGNGRGRHCLPSTRTRNESIMGTMSVRGAEPEARAERDIPVEVGGTDERYLSVFAMLWMYT